jgi:hypothetical protein
MPIFSLAEAAVELDRADSCVSTAHSRRGVFLPSRRRRVDAPAWPDHHFAGFTLSASTSAARIPMDRDGMGTLASVANTALKRAIMPINKQGQIVETARDARGAELGPTVRNVLVLSTSLAVIAFVVVYAAFLAD